MSQLEVPDKSGHEEGIQNS